MNQILKVKFTQVNAFLWRINTVDQCRIYIFKNLIRFLEHIYIYHLIRNIIFAKQSDWTGFHAQIHIFGHQDRFHFRILVGQVFGCRQNQMIGFLYRKRFPHFGSRHIACHDKQTSQSFAKLHSVGEKLIACQHIQFAHELTSIEIYLLVSFFELIQFFEYNKREVNIIFLKILQAIVVVKNNICV